MFKVEKCIGCLYSLSREWFSKRNKAKEWYKKRKWKMYSLSLFSWWLVKERIAKLSELNSRYQELNTALTSEIERIKGKEKDMLNEEKRMRYYSMLINEN